jgi:hypothetical protein
MKKEDRVSLEEIAALIERAEARSLKEGDEQIIKAVIERTLLIEQLVREGKIPSKRKLRRLLAIPRPEKPVKKRSRLKKWKPSSSAGNNEASSSKITPLWLRS